MIAWIPNLSSRDSNLKVILSQICSILMMRIENESSISLLPKINILGFVKIELI